MAMVRNYSVTKAENNPAVCPATPGARNDCMVALINGQVWGPASGWEWYIMPQPYDGQFYGEVVYFTSDVPGSYIPARTTNMQYLTPGYQRVVIPVSYLYPNDTYKYWFRESVPLSPGPSFSIWDGPS
jgi:hypothetical protein